VEYRKPGCIGYWFELPSVTGDAGTARARELVDPDIGTFQVRPEAVYPDLGVLWNMSEYSGILGLMGCGLIWLRMGCLGSRCLERQQRARENLSRQLCIEPITFNIFNCLRSIPNVLCTWSKGSGNWLTPVSARVSELQARLNRSAERTLAACLENSDKYLLGCRVTPVISGQQS
jgi:hypothetical protein